MLRCLASTLSNTEVAAQLDVSVNIVKTNQRTPYRKPALPDSATLSAGPGSSISIRNAMNRTPTDDFSARPGLAVPLRDRPATTR